MAARRIRKPTIKPTVQVGADTINADTINAAKSAKVVQRAMKSVGSLDAEDRHPVQSWVAWEA